MPCKIRIHLQGEAPCNPFQHSAGIQALFYNWLSFGNDSVAARIHDANQSKPFNLSPLSCNPNNDNECFFDVSILTDWLISPLVEGISRIGAKIHLGCEEYEFLGYEMISHSDWRNLLEHYDARTYYSFIILTPAAHHAPGVIRRSIVMPSPERYFGSWLNRWNACCPNVMPEDIMDILSENMVISEFSGGTKTARLEKGRPFIGFTGSIQFRIIAPEKLTEDTHRMLWALARFADYSGTGVGSSRGMGQTLFLIDL